MWNYVGFVPAYRFHGGFCHWQDEMEIFRGNDGLFPDRYDDTGALYIDSDFYQIFQNAPDGQSDRFGTALSDTVPSYNNIYYDRVFPEPAE